ncbi:hypothetical protein [Bacillus haynesii]|uniref:hypothetical protein n=1 Tax=Bacillus haynesii TaxID=1925021 RepID=UPI00227DB47A|nr:hypothetical protein [Bacillus haynesii]MCY8223505.1 hypothetical protein [Bacillus haynesii]MCY8241556.1 hypothetical protein [Bacillus haynesii]MCY8569177.1 hypothetical protein [Bacillus haynesii]MCY8664434.1 hypothetical protein [Bacillus haynesii]
MELRLQIAPAILNRIPSFKVGAVLYQDIEITGSPQMLKGRLRLFQESLFFDYADHSLEDESAVKEWHDAFRELNPSFSGRESGLERMLEDIKEQRFVEPKNSAVDLSRFFSLKYLIPVHIYDARNLKGPIKIEPGGPGEIITLSDDAGAFGTITENLSLHHAGTETKDALQLVFFRPSLSKEESRRLLESLTKMFEQIHGGEHISAVFP